MKKLKIYIDTSVVSHLDQQDAPEKMYDTKMLWEMIKSGEYEVYISPVTLAEVMECEEPKKSILLNYLSDINYIELTETDSVLSLADKYIEAEILRPKSLDDCQHIAYACVYDCDILVSWNFKHLVNIKTISGVKSVNALVGYREMPIYTPTFLIAGGTEDDS